MATTLMRALDAAFGHPRGAAGRIGGWIMARGNAEQEQWAVEQAGLRSDSQVLIVGYGPGVGVVLAAAVVRSADGCVIGVDPSPDMRAMAARRCVSAGVGDQVELREGGAEHTGCLDASVDVAVSVNNIMLWDRPAGFAELHRVLTPGGRLVVTVHRHVLGVAPTHLRADAVAAGFVDVGMTVRQRRFNSPAIELLARRPSARVSPEGQS